jgi:hypothetical protein
MIGIVTRMAKDIRIVQLDMYCVLCRSDEDEEGQILGKVVVVSALGKPSTLVP